ncbi:glutathione-dependent formaldehyde-activating GFA [Azospirillum sp. B510]|uniref:GFA family protein n=1 Tax=Azospirillum sp. (strain B510) TaxID=137722 RepID=UPI0001C4BDB2|nr:GFA family protein [Azospirillum sp. B510]BAI72197.1 glutathione-dependent formaldehyde-activating GFA [Azospirillum sp. B510]
MTGDVSGGGAGRGTELSGGCLCGGVRFLLAERPDGVVTCHCSQCRRFHGHFGAYITVPRDTVTFDADGTLSWYRSSSFAERGFCGRCGSSLFWKGDGKREIEIAAGCLDQPTGLTTLCHGYVADKADYYDIADGLEQFAGSSEDE